MSIVCAYSDEDGVWIGSDGRMSNGDHIECDDFQKWLTVGGIHIGFAGAVEFGPLLRKVIKDFPAFEMTTAGFYALAMLVRQECNLRDWKPDQSDGDPSFRTAHALLVNYWSIWHLDISLNAEMIQPCRFIGIGSGRNYASGAAHALEGNDGDQIIRSAVRAAIRYNTGCGGEPYIRRIEKPRGSHG